MKCCQTVSFFFFLSFFLSVCILVLFTLTVPASRSPAISLRRLTVSIVDLSTAQQSPGKHVPIHMTERIIAHAVQKCRLRYFEQKDTQVSGVFRHVPEGRIEGMGKKKEVIKQKRNVRVFARRAPIAGAPCAWTRVRNKSFRRGLCFFLFSPFSLISAGPALSLVMPIPK